ncbi:MAG: hypothetical protein HPY75_09800 [Actinobacteria bacterium]|nr:hypothetical protein [Actinomycetota bacterium]
MGAIGEVTAISESKITIEDERSGSSRTYSIKSSTQILDGEKEAEIDDIEVGDRVMVVPDGSDAGAAARIIINPGMGGPGGRVEGNSAAAPST